MADRITYNPDGETIDEIVMTGASVHLEQLDERVYMLILENQEHHYHLRVGGKKGAFMYEEHPLDEVPGVKKKRVEARLKCILRPGRKLSCAKCPVPKRTCRALAMMLWGEERCVLRVVMREILVLHAIRVDKRRGSDG